MVMLENSPPRRGTIKASAASSNRRLCLDFLELSHGSALR
jgi:hypothetical protein